MLWPFDARDLEAERHDQRRVDRRRRQRLQPGDDLFRDAARDRRSFLGCDASGDGTTIGRQQPAASSARSRGQAAAP